MKDDDRRDWVISESLMLAASAVAAVAGAASAVAVAGTEQLDSAALVLLTFCGSVATTSWYCSPCIGPAHCRYVCT